MTPCNPSKPIAVCVTCSRYQPWLPHLAEVRPATLCMDATVVARNGRCPMFEHKQAPVGCEARMDVYVG